MCLHAHFANNGFTGSHRTSDVAEQKAITVEDVRTVLHGGITSLSLDLSSASWSCNLWGITERHF